MGIYWTFASIQIAPMSGDREIPEWHRELRVSVENLVGTGLAEFNLFGYGEWKLRMEAHIEDASVYAAIRAQHGQVGALSDGTTTWNDVLFVSEELRPTKGGWQGTLEFSRSGGA
jgi:hypothetical protein